MKNKEPYSSLHKILGFYPDKIELYQQAFIHKSAIAEGIIEQSWRNNERLEFLGDAILSTVVATSAKAFLPIPVPKLFNAKR